MTLGAPFRAVRDLFPFTREGRQTLVYLVFAGCGPSLTLLVMWAMNQSLGQPKLWPTFTRLATIVAVALLIITIALGMFVSIRALKISRGGIEASGGPDDVTVTAVAAVGVKAGESE